jgi:threonylcarbamoyladenosine tRNA methylthiotransferase MtaB
MIEEKKEERNQTYVKISFHTLGCKVNQYETQALKEKFINRGYEIVGEGEFADIYVINTCTVTGLSDRKSRQYIRRVKKINPDSITAVIGCYAQVSPDEAKNIEGVNIVAGTNEKNNLPDYIDEYLKNKNQALHIKPYEELKDYEDTGVITAMDSRTRAYIKVQEGCNKFCSYCIIPYARGKVRSRAVEDVIKEAQSLIDMGYKELVLTGINTALYGTEPGFGQYKKEESEEQVYGIEVIVNALNRLPGDFRIRLGSLEPNVINADYAKRLLKYEKLCPHMHLSLQSGSDRILKQMNRNYTAADYLELVHVLKSHDKGYGLTTDIIVGFPGETEEDFNDSINLVRQAKLSKVHVFKYSKREGTKAAEMKGHIAPEVKARRSAKLMEVATEVGRQFIRDDLGSLRRVLFEEYDEEKGLLVGLTENYIKVYYEGPKDLCNNFLKLRLVEPYKDGVLAENI